MTSPTRNVESAADLRDALGSLGVRAYGALILIGGADFTEPDELAALGALFGHVAAHAERTATAVIDGGTDSGVMRLIAEARADAGERGEAGARFPLIGVAPAGAFDRPTRTGAAIEPAHDHDVILAVPGDQFGDETSWLFAAADMLHHGSLAPTLVVNGGDLALREAHARLAAGGVVVAVDGSGRAADELARDLAEDAGLRASGRLRSIPIGVDEAGLAAALEDEA